MTNPNMKRAHSDSESDDDFDSKSGCNVGHGMDRKKRRGIIEKRRRDRINSSLSELRRLVPAAFEKQGSAKLEKAEILQMTVDHLKCLHAKGLNGYNLDTAALAVDYRSVGFRECVAEVARYMVAVEGMDIQDPLRLRLLSHLQCYSAQREAAAKASLSNMNSGWGGHHHHMAAAAGSAAAAAVHHAHHQYNSPAASQMTTMGSMMSGGGSSDHMTGAMTAAGSAHYPATDHSRMSSQSHEQLNMAAAASMRTAAGSQMSGSSTSGSAGSAQMTAGSVLSGLSQVHSQFPGVTLSMNNMPGLSPTGMHYAGAGLGKPYRPWGAELAY